MTSVDSVVNVDRHTIAGRWTGVSKERVWTQRRRLMAALRMAHRVLGVNRDNPGLGSPGGSVGRIGPGRGTKGLLLAGISLGALFATPAYAQYAAGGGSATGTQSVAIGTGSSANNTRGTAIGPSARAGNVYATAVGSGSVASGDSSLAMGNTASATGANSIALGRDNSAAGAQSLAIGWGTSAGEANSMAIGTFSNAAGANALALGLSSSAAGASSVAVGHNSVASAARGTAVGQAAIASGASGSTAVGVSAQATFTNGSAFGFGARAEALASTALGQGAAATADFGTAVGRIALAGGVGSVAIGGNLTGGANASGDNAVAIGAQSVANAVAAIAMGNNARADAADAVAIGTNSTATGGKAVAIGAGNFASGDGAVAIGDPNTATGNGAVAQGMDNTATGNGSVAMGNTNMVGGGGQAVSVAGTAAQGAVGIGFQNTVVGQGSVAIGNTSSALAAGSLAFGDTAVATNIGDVALGSGSATSAAVGTASAVIDGAAYTFAGGAPTSVVSVGAVGAERQIQNVAAGQITGTSTDAVNGSQLFATNQAVDALGATVEANATHYVSMNDGGVIRGNFDNDGATGLNSLAIGPNAVSGSRTSAAIGNGASTATGVYFDSVAVGFGANTANTAGVAVGARASSTGVGGVAVGERTTSGQYGIALGSGSGFSDGASATGLGAIAIGGGDTRSAALGRPAAATGDRAIAIGQTSVASVTGAVALGYQSSAANAGDVALGSGSTTAAAVATTGTTINGAVYAFAGTTPTSTVSIGSVGAERTLTNLAAGRIDAGSTDGINGSQLFATNQAVEAVAALSGNTSERALKYDWTDTNGDGIVDPGEVNYSAAALAGVGGTTLTNVADGALDATSTDAVNGSQLFATNELVDQNTTDIAANTTNIANIDGRVTTIEGDLADINSGAGIKYFRANSALADSQALGTDSVAVGPNAIANNTGDVALGSGSTTSAAVATADTVINGQTYAFAGAAPTSTVSIGAAGAERTLTNLAAGRIDAASTDGINGSQLFATNQAVEAVAAVSGNTSERALKYDWTDANGDGVVDPGEVNYNAATLAGVGGTTLSNVADGTLDATSTEAVNGAQLFATNQAVDQNTTDIATNTTDIANLDGRVTTVEGDLVTIGGQVTQNTTDIADLGNTITNIAGDTSTAYTEANGDGLRYARTNERGLAEIDAFAQGVGSSAVGYGAMASADNAVALGRGSSSTIEGGVALGSGSVVDRAIAPATGVLPAGPATIVYNTSDQQLLGAVSVGSAGSYRQITNVADGTQAQDAVTIRQLQGAIASVSTTPTQFFHANSTAPDSLAIGTDSIAVGPTTVVNADNGIGIGNAAIVEATAPGGTAIGQDAHVIQADGLALGTSSQAGGVQSVAIGAGAASDHSGAVALGAGSVTQAATHTVGAAIDGTAYAFAGATPDSVVSIGAVGAERQLVNVAAGRLDAASTDAVNGSQLFATNQAVDLIGASQAALGDRAVQYDGAVGDPRDTITLAGAAGTRITNLQAGNVSAASSDAVNGSQLHGVSQSIATNLGGGAVVNPDGSVSGPTYSMLGGSFSTVYDTFAAVDLNLANLNSLVNNINNGAGVRYFHANSTAADSQALGADSVAIGPGSVATGEGSLAAGAGATAVGSGAVALGEGAQANNANDVALGAGSVTETAVGTTGTTIRGTDYEFAGGAPAGTVSVGDVGSERTITNVAAGRVSADSTDAVNGSQLHATNTAIESIQAGIGDLDESAVRYDMNPDGARGNSISLLGGDPNAPVLISNVAAGVADNDAVNVGQLRDQVGNVLVQANSYTDSRVALGVQQANSYTDEVAIKTLNQSREYTDLRFGELNRDMSEIRDQARSAAALGLAAGSLRYDERPGKLSIAVGAGAWEGSGAVAWGLGYTSDDSDVRFNASGAISNGDVGVGVGLSFTIGD